MPYVSDAQRRAMNAKARSGKIPQDVVDEFNAESEGMDLPERVKRKVPPKKKTPPKKKAEAKGKPTRKKDKKGGH